MKKTLIVLVLVLVIICCAGAACAEGTAKKALVKGGISIHCSNGKTSVFQVGETVQLTIRVENISGADFASEMYLFDPAKENVAVFPLLKEGESAEWTGNWTITEEQAETKKLTYRIQFYILDENGEKTAARINLNRKILINGREKYTPEPTPESTPEPTPELTPQPEDRARVILYNVLKKDGEDGKIGLYCMDEAGDLWGIDETDAVSEEEIVQILRERCGMKRINQLMGGGYDDITMDAKLFKNYAVMADVVQPAEGNPVATGKGTKEFSTYALRFDRSGEAESVLLGICGNTVFENKDPNAQALYLFNWRQFDNQYHFPGIPAYYADEEKAPHGFEMISMRDFFKLQHVDAQTAEISAVMNDCEEGPIEEKMTEKDRKFALDLLERGVVIGLENDWSVTGGTTSYIFRDAEGTYLGSIELYEGLAVGRDGMYRYSLLPVSAENLPEEEQEMLRFKLNGVEYEMGKSTPRDLILNGWKCYIEWDGTYAFTNGEGSDPFYVYTRGGSVDEPISDFSVQFASGVEVEYCGFDGHVNPEDREDPDTAWYALNYEEYRAEHPEEDLPEIEDVFDHWYDEEYDEEEIGDGKYWSPMKRWIETLGEEEPDMDNGTQIYVKLSDGRTLTLFTAACPVCLHLSD